MSEQPQSSGEAPQLTTDSTTNSNLEVLAQVHAKLREKGVSPERLVSINIGDEDTIIGEAPGANALVGGRVCITNPKRMIRFQNAEGENFSVRFAVVDFDVVETGMIEVVGRIGYWFGGVDTVAQIRLCNMYLGYLEMRDRIREVSGGRPRIIRPDMMPVPINGLLHR
jgi:hypothetical protein